MRKYLLFSTILAVFSNAVVLHSTIDIRLLYFIILFNLPLFLFSWHFSLPKYYLLILAYISVSGMLEVIFGPDRLSQYLKEVVGITLVSLYFYLFFKGEKRSVLEIFDIYAKAAFWVSLLGIALSLIQSLYLHQFVPVQSVLSEPADFSMVVIPSFYYYASPDNICRRWRWRMWTILVALVFSVSSTGYLGLLLCAALLLRRRSWGLFFAPLSVGLLFMIAYASSEHFRLRVDDTLQSSSSMDVSGSNLSTYALVSNAYVAARAFEERPIFGYGVGGHVVAHAKYIYDLPGAETVGTLMDLNAQDANSLFLRTLSEFGLVGVVLLLLFLVKFWTPKDATYSRLSAAVFVYLCLYLLRGGNWFSPELYFFVWAYVLSSDRAVAEPLRNPRSQTISAHP